MGVGLLATGSFLRGIIFAHWGYLTVVVAMVESGLGLAKSMTVGMGESGGKGRRFSRNLLKYVGNSNSSNSSTGEAFVE